MLPQNLKRQAERGTKESSALYRAWEGQLFVQEKPVCNIALWSPFHWCLPAQLSSKLEIKYIAGVSELRKKLPEAAFRKRNHANREVCGQGMFYLYEVELLHGNEQKVDLLIGTMKEKKLALVKYLNDGGVLLFLPSPALAQDSSKKDSAPKNLASLQALFIFSSPRPQHLADKEQKWEQKRNETSLHVTRVLPGLRYALSEAAKPPDPECTYSRALVKRKLQEFAKRDWSPPVNAETANGLPSSFDLSSETPAQEAFLPKCCKASFSHLQFYLSDPQSYTLDVFSALAGPKDGSPPFGRSAGQVADGSLDLNSDPLPPGGANETASPSKSSLDRQPHPPSKEAGLKTGQVGDRSLQWCKRKSSHPLSSSARKKWSPLKVLCMMESSKRKMEKEKKKRKKKEKKENSAKEIKGLSLSKNPDSSASSKEPTVKLKILQNPLRRKRGAEVLSAEFVQGTRREVGERAACPLGNPSMEDGQTHLKNVKKFKNEEMLDMKRPTPRKNIQSIPAESPSGSQRCENAPVDQNAAHPDVCLPPERGDCDSHALNMLADLALSSCGPPLVGNHRRDAVHFRPLREHCLQRGKLTHKSSDHEYHRATKNGENLSLPGQASWQSASKTIQELGLPSNPQERSAANSNQKRKLRPSMAEPHVARSNEAGDFSDSSVSLISSEHSYASPVSESVKKGTLCSLRNGVKQVKPDPVDGKGPPFQQPQDGCKRFGNNLPLSRSTVMAARLRDDFTKSHQVTSCDKTVQVTFQWDSEYLFTLDSKYTNNSLEKTVIRAVHGPWDVGLSDNTDEMKLILHMWVALFYSKPSQALTVRKVVEHSNPAKYVSLNSLVDPSEPVDRAGGASVLEKRVADSLSGAALTMNKVQEDGASSPSKKPFSCHELSSANCIEDEGSIRKPEEAKDLLSKEEEEETHPPAKRDCVDPVPFSDQVVGEAASLPGPVLPAENLHGGDERGSPQRSRTGAEAETSQDASSAGALQSDAAGGLPESSGIKQEVAVSVKSCGTASPSGEVEKERLQAGGPKRHMPNAVGLEPNVKSREADNPRQKVQDLPSLRTDEEDGDGESMEWGSIDLALSESNDADVEPRDLDLEQENEECPEENCVKEGDSGCNVAPLCNGLLTSPDDLPLHQTSQDDKGTLADSASIQDSAEFPKDWTIQDKSLGSLDFLESVKTPRIPNQIDLVNVSPKYRGMHLALPASQEVSPAHQKASDEVAEPTGEQEDCPKTPVQHAFPNQMDLIEDISQDSTEPDDSHPLHLREPKTQLYVDSVQKKESTQPEFIGSQTNLVVSPQSIMLAKKLDLVEGLSQEEEGTHLDTTIPLKVTTVHQQSSDEAAESLEDRRAHNIVQVDLVEDFPREKEVICPPDSVLLQVKEAKLAGLNVVVQEDQKTRQKEESRMDSPCAEESRGSASEANFESATCCVEASIGVSTKSQETAPDEEWPSGPVTVSEDINTFVGELVDTVCALVVESEEVSAKKNPGLDWISSVILECVTPPESDDESRTLHQLAQIGSKWADSLEWSCVVEDREENAKANEEGQEFCSSPDETKSSYQVDAFERKGPKGNEVTSIATEIFPSCGTTNPKCRLPLLETTTSPEADSSCVSMSDQVKQAHDSPEEPICDRKDCSRKVSVENMPFVLPEHRADSSGEQSDALIDEDPQEAQDGCEELEQVEAGRTMRDSEGLLHGERTQLPISSAVMDMDCKDESPLVGRDQGLCKDLHPRCKFEESYHTQFSGPASITEVERLCGSGPGKESHKDDWVSVENGRVPNAESGAFSFGFKKDDWSVSHSLDTERKPGPFGDYINFSVTKKHKEKTRTFHSFSKRHNRFSGDLGLVNSLNRSWRYFSDPVQNTLDMECLRFHYKVKQIVKKSQLSTSTNIYTKRVPPQVTSEMLPLRKVSDVSVLSSPARSGSPLSVTIRNPSLRGSERCSEFFDPLPDLQGPFSPAAALRSQGGHGPGYPLHLEKLTNNKLSNFRGDALTFVDEFAQLSRAMAFRSGQGYHHGRNPTATSEDTTAEQRCPVAPPRPAGYDVLFTELHNALHFRLRDLAQEACRKPFLFYLMEADGDPFFGRVRNLLADGGHAEVDLAQFCKGRYAETDRLLVIIRNEDIFSLIHEVPSLLRLKHLPNVIFAGVDSPEDPLDHTYQELFLSGGFVVSDNKVLEAMTVGELKDVIKALEDLNGHGGWKWLLHYREAKNLREEAREDPDARAKEGVLKSCQGANITETLYYHECDSRSCPRLERFNCLLNLQIQHISKRFAVFLTAEDTSASREALEDKGILGLEVGEFLATAQEIVASFRRGFW